MKEKVRIGWQLVEKPHYKGKAWRMYRRKVLKVCNISSKDFNGNKKMRKGEQEIERNE